MRRVIDLECVLPADENGVARQYFGAAGHRIGEGDPELLPPLPGYGFENYATSSRDGTAARVSRTPQSLLLSRWLRSLRRWIATACKPR